MRFTGSAGFSARARSVAGITDEPYLTRSGGAGFGEVSSRAASGPLMSLPQARIRAASSFSANSLPSLYCVATA